MNFISLPVDLPVDWRLRAQPPVPARCWLAYSRVQFRATATACSAHQSESAGIVCTFYASSSVCLSVCSSVCLSVCQTGSQAGWLAGWRARAACESSIQLVFALRAKIIRSRSRTKKTGYQSAPERCCCSLRKREGIQLAAAKTAAANDRFR